VNIVRTLGIFVALAALSFVLGFFVLARLIPGSTKPAIAAPIPSEARPLAAARDSSAAPALRPKRGVIVASNNTVVQPPKKISTPGPSLDPVSEPPAEAAPAGVQKPRRVQESTTRDTPPSTDDSSSTAAAGDIVETPKPQPAQAATTVVHRKRRRHAVDHKTTPSQVRVADSGDNSDDANTADRHETVTKKIHRSHRVVSDDTTMADSQEPPVRKTQRPRRVASVASDTTDEPAPAVKRPRRTRRVAHTDEVSAADIVDPTVQKPHRPHRTKVVSTVEHDAATADRGDSERPAKRRRTDTEAATGSYFHVGLGAFHSRDAAVHEVERARGKGFSTQIVPVTHNGRTLYRVQAGAYHERMRAETVKQNLQDASLDASVTEQHR
jgi:cell division septation protein DedD